MYDTLEQLEQGELIESPRLHVQGFLCQQLKPSDLPALDVCVDAHGRWWSMSNRRLLVLRMYQAVHMDRVVYARCKLRSNTHGKMGNLLAASLP